MFVCVHYFTVIMFYSLYVSMYSFERDVGQLSLLYLREVKLTIRFFRTLFR